MARGAILPKDEEVEGAGRASKEKQFYDDWQSSIIHSREMVEQRKACENELRDPGLRAW